MVGLGTMAIVGSAFVSVLGAGQVSVFLRGGFLKGVWVMFECLECGRKFATTAAAEKAANNGCPKCGGVDIDLARKPAPKKGPGARALEEFKRLQGFK